MLLCQNTNEAPRAGVSGGRHATEPSRDAGFTRLHEALTALVRYYDIIEHPTTRGIDLLALTGDRRTGPATREIVVAS